MTQAANITRSDWLAAGASLAAMGGAGAVTIEALAAYAAATPESFLREFHDLPAFQHALLTQGLDEMRDLIVSGTAELPAGGERLVRALELWLDGHLQRPWVRELNLLLADAPAAARTLRQRINGFILMLQLEFEQIGWPRAAMAARLSSAAALEVAAAEFDARAALPELRQTLCAYLRH